MAVGRPIVLDDRLLIHELLVGLDTGDQLLHTTTYWYYRACRAAALGAGGHLSGPFRALAPAQQQRAIHSLLRLRDDIGLPVPRRSVPAMVDLAARHPQLNLLNLEALAVARELDAAVWLSERGADGLLPRALEAEGIAWRSVAVS